MEISSDDPGNDGNAIGNEEIFLVFNVGADNNVRPLAAKQVFVNTVEKWPRVLLRHLVLLADKLKKLSSQVILDEESVVNSQSSKKVKPWRFWLTTGFPWPQDKPMEVEVEGSGFVWSWDKHGTSYMTPLIRSIELQAGDKATHMAKLPEGVTGFTFFWTGGDDTKTGQSAGHREGRDFMIAVS